MFDAHDSRSIGILGRLLATTTLIAAVVYGPNVLAQVDQVMASPEAVSAWQNDKVGMFIHWGPGASRIGVYRLKFKIDQMRLGR